MLEHQLLNHESLMSFADARALQWAGAEQMRALTTYFNWGTAKFWWSSQVQNFVALLKLDFSYMWQIYNFNGNASSSNCDAHTESQPSNTIQILLRNANLHESLINRDCVHVMLLTHWTDYLLFMRHSHLRASLSQDTTDHTYVLMVPVLSWPCYSDWEIQVNLHCSVVVVIRPVSDW